MSLNVYHCFILRRSPHLETFHLQNHCTVCALQFNSQGAYKIADLSNSLLHEPRRVWATTVAEYYETDFMEFVSFVSYYGGIQKIDGLISLA